MGRHVYDSDDSQRSRSRRHKSTKHKKRSRSSDSSSSDSSSDSRHRHKKHSKYRKRSRSRSYDRHSKSSRRRRSTSRHRKHKRRHRSSSSSSSSDSSRDRKSTRDRRKERSRYRSSKDKNYSKTSRGSTRERSYSKEKDVSNKSSRSSKQVAPPPVKQEIGNANKPIDLTEMSESQKIDREKAIAEIQDSDFNQSSFKSSRGEKVSEAEKESDLGFNFGTAAEIKVKGPKLEENSILSPYLFGDPEEREEKYLKKIMSIRQRVYDSVAC